MSTHKYVIPEQAQLYQGAQAASTPTMQHAPAPTPTQPIFPWANPKVLKPNNLPSYFRPTVSVFPASKATELSAKIPLGIIVNPANVVGIPCIDYSQSQIQRCANCYSYLSPYSRILPDGLAFTCPFCGATTKSKSKDQAPMFNIPELSNCVYDMIAPRGFISRIAPNAQPVYFFLVDISAEAVSTGFSIQFLESLKALVDTIPPYVLIGLMTVSHKVTLYDFKRSSTVIVADLSDPVVPTGSFAPISECKDSFITIINEILQDVKTNPPQPGHCLASALNVASLALLSYGGIIISGFCGFPTVNINDAQKETLIRDIGFKLNRNRISTHLFFLPSLTQKESHLSILGLLPRLTNGDIHYYRTFDPQTLHADLFDTISKNYLWDASMRLRCKTGINITSISCNCSISSKTVYFPISSTNNSMLFNLMLDQNFKSPTALFQAAFLWTNENKQRMIRIFTFEVPTSDKPQEVRNSIDEAALAVLLAKRSSTIALKTKQDEAAQFIRKEFNSICSGGVKFPTLPYLVHSLLCSKSLRNVNVNENDQKIQDIIKLQSMSLIDTMLYLYPEMYVLDNINNLKQLPLNQQSFAEGNCFLVHTVSKVYIWISPGATPQYLTAAFGVGAVDQLDLNNIPKLETNENKIINEKIAECYNLSGKYLPVEIIPPGSEKEALFAEFLVDCSKACGSDVGPFIGQTNVLI
ncbi:Sec23/Sec24 trunk domain containing protein [Histomonas meleagridis]|uniref:Sec23/Sec24 trunk domain containing protein n=1 Tax=Histomonas meleagridis TaxID=135588 RepID=UPI003559829D|nr:Sec23/Sec24 trunk domain containing protein [Histomonas meleagridis]KAH0800297.1 Sec23/Sec24 trunk domain containing protein [Histomonas meleagridis]